MTLCGFFTRMNLTCTYVWAILGFIVPIVILVYCNMKLTQSLRHSWKLRRLKLEGQQRNSLHRHSDVRLSSQQLVTITMVTIVTMFFFLVLPSEILHFYGELAEPEYHGVYRNLMLTANLLQAVNFSINFVLYCIVNHYFR